MIWTQYLNQWIGFLYISPTWGGGVRACACVQIRKLETNVFEKMKIHQRAQNMFVPPFSISHTCTRVWYYTGYYYSLAWWKTLEETSWHASSIHCRYSVCQVLSLKQTTFVNLMNNFFLEGRRAVVSQSYMKRLGFLLFLRNKFSLYFFGTWTVSRILVCCSIK